MKKQSIKTKKQAYQSPDIEKIVLDLEISLAFESTPPEGPNEDIYSMMHEDKYDVTLQKI